MQQQHSFASIGSAQPRRNSVADRILVVDDSQAIHEDFRKIFGGSRADEALLASEAALFGEADAARRGPAFEIDSAYQGQEGLALVQRAIAEQRPYAMAFIDVRMPPGWDGVETVAQIWQCDPGLQVVICTAYSDYSWSEMLQRLGHPDRLVILKKPFDNIEVLQLAAALTEKWRLAQEARRHAENLECMVQARTEELRAAKEQYRALLESTSAVPWEMDAQTGACTYIGRQVESRWGWPAGRFAERGFFQSCIHPDDRAAFSRALSQVSPAAEVDLECRIRKAGGAYLHVRTLMDRACSDPTRGKVRGVSLDLTLQKKLEAELRQAQKLESVGRLAAGVAHEINTPVQFISDSCHFLRDGLKDLNKLLDAYRGAIAAAAKGELAAADAAARTRAAEVEADAEYLAEGLPAAVERALEGLNRVATIVRSMKEFAHADNPNLAAADLNRALQTTLTICRSEYKHVAEVQTDFGEIPPVYCHVGELNQVFLNLIVNAAHAIGDVMAKTGKPGVIRVGTRSEGEQVAIFIGDTGTGIPEDVREQIFDPFFTTKEVGKGSGQGLAIARSVVVGKHRGTLTFDTKLGVGTTFTIRLPIRPAAVPAQEAAAA